MKQRGGGGVVIVALNLSLSHTDVVFLALYYTYNMRHGLLELVLEEKRLLSHQRAAAEGSTTSERYVARLLVCRRLL